jgi:hypothetical protein
MRLPVKYLESLSVVVEASRNLKNICLDNNDAKLIKTIGTYTEKKKKKKKKILI